MLSINLTDMSKAIIKTCVLIAVFIIPQLATAQIEEINLIKDSLYAEYEKIIKETPAYIPKSIEMTEDRLRNVLDAQPSFAVYKDVFFVTGIPLDRGINRNTADALFQISIRQRLTKSYLPFNSFAYLTYTQKSFWDIYADSSPFRDTNYNPGIGVGKYIIKDNKLKGAAFIQIEHESNGRDSLDSRSWNYLSFFIKYFYNPRLTLTLKAWIPVVDGDNNQDLLDYRGLATFTGNFISKNDKWWFSAELTPRKGFGNVNTTLTAAFRVSKRQNQYIYARFYNGKGDSLIEYNKYSMNIRFGICIKPDFYSVY